MGGVGSGRHYWWSSKSTTGSMLQLDVRRLQRDGLLWPGNRFEWHWTRDGEPAGNIQIAVSDYHLRLIYRSRSCGSDWEDMDYNVNLLSQPCHFGGERKWFACPARGCGRRVAILYGGRVYACRSCYQLAYPSTREQTFQRHQRRASKIRTRLGWGTAPCDPWGERPKGMHAKTFERLVTELDYHERASDYTFATYFNARLAHLDF